MYDFSERKFLSLPLERQHKKCAELLKHLYEQLIHQNPTQPEWDLYRLLLQWMKDLPSIVCTPQAIADRYHQHLQNAKQQKKEHHLLPTIRKGDRNQSKSDPWPITIYLDHLRSAHNVGSILRTVEALGLGEVCFSPDTPFITHKQVQDTSMGTYAWVKCEQSTSLNQLPRPLIALETSDEAISLDDFIFPTCFTLVIGNEEYGCSETILHEADYLVEIPLRGRKNSLNVANAFALVAGEIRRQRKIKDFYEKTKI